MQQGYATANLLHALNQRKRDPWLDSENEILAQANPAGDRRDPEARKFFRGLLIVLCALGILAILLRDHEVRQRELAHQQIAVQMTGIAPQLPASARAPRDQGWEECVHMRLTWTPYTYKDCKVFAASGKRIAHKDGL